MIEIALVPASILFLTMQFEHTIAKQQQAQSERLAVVAEVQENIRFVRQAASTPHSKKPFSGMQLSNAALSDLDLGCRKRHDEDCARFDRANLRRVTMIGTVLLGASFLEADLSGGDFIGVKFTDANLGSVSLRDTRLSEVSLAGADLQGADMTGATFDGVDLDGACYDNTTKWPVGLQPPPPNPKACVFTVAG